MLFRSQSSQEAIDGGYWKGTVGKEAIVMLRLKWAGHESECGSRIIPSRRRTRTAQGFSGGMPVNGEHACPAGKGHVAFDNGQLYLRYHFSERFS